MQTNNANMALPIVLGLVVAAGVVGGAFYLKSKQSHDADEPHASPVKQGNERLGPLPRALTPREIAMLTPAQRETYDRHVKYWGGRTIMYDREMTEGQVQQYIQSVNDRPPEGDGDTASASTPRPPETHQHQPRDSRPEQPPSPPTAKPFEMVPCAECSGTGQLEGERAIALEAERRARRNVEEYRRSVKILGGSADDSAMQKQYEIELKMQTDLVKFEAKKAEWNGRRFVVVCPVCNGTKWRSTAEDK